MYIIIYIIMFKNNIYNNQDQVQERLVFSIIKTRGLDIIIFQQESCFD